MAGVQVVGREAEREAIARWLDLERPATLSIDGEAGIGKSTLWSFAVALAIERGDRVLSWRASTAERELAFAALNALFDGPSVADVIERLPEPRRRALQAALGLIEPALQPAEPMLVGSAVADTLKALAGQQALVVAIDDVQWSDEASEAALAFAIRRLRSEPVGLVLARRTGRSEATAERGPSPAPGDTLIAAFEGRQHIDVGPMSVGALGRLIQERLGVAHPRPLMIRLHQACGGNPFLGLEISRSLAARRAEPAPGEPLPVPPEAGPLVRDHLASLSRDARRSLMIVAMSADPTLTLIRQVLGDASERALDEAIEKGILEVDAERVRPSHPLFASTAYSDAPPGERRALREVLAGTGRSFGLSLINQMVDHTAGYPYFLQFFGAFTCSRIGLEHIELADYARIESALLHELDLAFFEDRFLTASPVYPVGARAGGEQQRYCPCAVERPGQSPSSVCREALSRLPRFRLALRRNRIALRVNTTGEGKKSEHPVPGDQHYLRLPQREH